MTTEEDFQRQLDTNAADWATRLLFADWLDARGDPRGPGYRALAVQQRRPLKSEKKEASWWFCSVSAPDCEFFNHLWRDWFSLLPVGEGNDLFWPVLTENGGIKTRRECEDAAALAFAQLPPERRAELLTARPAG